MSECDHKTAAGNYTLPCYLCGMSAIEIIDDLQEELAEAKAHQIEWNKKYMDMKQSWFDVKKQLAEAKAEKVCRWRLVQHPESKAWQAQCKDHLPVAVSEGMRSIISSGRWVKYCEYCGGRIEVEDE